MTFSISAELIGKRGPLVDTKAVRRDIARVNQKIAKRMKRSMARPTHTWRHTVVFHQKTSSAGMTVKVYTNNAIYAYLDEGTSIRYAVMTEDFSPKTRPGSLVSRPGSGGLAKVDVNDPREGIEARGFTDQVEAKHGPEYQTEIDKVLDRAARKNA